MTAVSGWTISGQQLRRYASGAVDAADIHRLRVVRTERTMLLLTRLARLSDRLREPVELIAAAQDRDPAAVADLLAWPWIGAWAAQTVHRFGEPEVETYLFGVAAAAATRAGLPRGRLVLPGVERVMIPTIGSCRIRGNELSWPIPEGGSLSASRRISTGHGEHRLDLVLEDLDPFRLSAGSSRTSRLPAAKVSAWNRLVEDAWRLLVDYAPGWASELSAGMVSVVPLRADRAAVARSGTHVESFGGFGATLHGYPATFAATMIHEFQHSKLNQIANLLPLTGPDRGRRYISPWRTDPRPLIGLVHGLYAFTAVCEMWGSLRPGPSAAAADLQFAVTLLQSRQALHTALSAEDLTDVGRDLVMAVGERIEALGHRDVDPHVVAAATEILESRGEVIRYRPGS